MAVPGPQLSLLQQLDIVRDMVADAARIQAASGNGAAASGVAAADGGT